MSRDFTEPMTADEANRRMYEEIVELREALDKQEEYIKELQKREEDNIKKLHQLSDENRTVLRDNFKLKKKYYSLEDGYRSAERFERKLVQERAQLISEIDKLTKASNDEDIEV